jgi:acyl carrier protein
MSTTDPIASIVLTTIRQLGEDFDLPALCEATLTTPLFGDNGTLDSMGLVHLLADLEEAFSQKTGNPFILADERAMSARKSPFRSVETLIAAIHERL